MSNYNQSKSKVVDRAIRNDNFRGWFKNSKVVDSDGDPQIVYRGDYDVDSMGDRFDKSELVAGGFYFTDDPTVASGYTDKFYTSEDQVDYGHWFKVKSDKDGNFYDLTEIWSKLTTKKKYYIIKRAREVNIDSDSGEIVPHSQGGIPADYVDMYAKRETKNDYVRALVTAFLESGFLFIDWGDEGDDDAETFERILQYVGFDVVYYKNPRQGQGGVTPVFLSVQNPLDVDNDVNEFFYDELHAEAVKEWEGDEDYTSFDKNKITRESWFETLRKDIEEGSTHTWTVVPDPIIEALQNMGYDGIKDRGGKHGGDHHTVWIVFEPSQIKSIHNIGTWKRDSDVITEKKLLREFDEHDVQFMDEAYTVYQELKTFINSLDSDILIKMSQHPFKKDELKMLITSDIHSFSVDLSIGFGKFLAGWHMALSVSDQHDPIIIFNYSDLDTTTYDNIKDFLSDLVTTYKHSFIHEFAHYKQHTRGEELYSADGTNEEYVNSPSEFDAFLKEVYSWVLEHLMVAKQQDQGFFDYLLNLSDQGFVDYIKANNDQLHTFIEMLNPENLKTFEVKTRKLKSFAKNKL